MQSIDYAIFSTLPGAKSSGVAPRIFQGKSKKMQETPSIFLVDSSLFKGLYDSGHGLGAIQQAQLRRGDGSRVTGLAFKQLVASVSWIPKKGRYLCDSYARRIVSDASRSREETATARQGLFPKAQHKDVM
jgi:hypothetical protein